MNILLEQEFDFSDFDKKANANVTTTPKSPTLPTDTKSKKKNQSSTTIDTKKAEKKTKTVTSNNTNKTQLTVSDKDIMNRTNVFDKFFFHSVSFLKKFGPLSTQSNLDEETMLTILKTYTITNPVFNNTKLTLIYIDWILRLTTLGSFSNKYMIKNQKQYNYVFSKNGDSSITIDLLLSIPKNKTLKGINYIFNPKTPIGSGLEMSTPSDTKNSNTSTSNDGFTRLVSSVRNGVFPTIKYSDDLQTSTFNEGRSPEFWHSLVMQFYNDAVYGPPKKQFKTKF